MTLHVSFEQFSKTVHGLLETRAAFVTAKGMGSLVTAADSGKGFIVACIADVSPAQAKTKLTRSGLEAFDGAWTLSDDLSIGCGEASEIYIAAVSYKSGESMPGVWVDAHRSAPTQVQVLRLLYDEFRETGELPDVSFEEFVRLSEPNVVIVSPNEIQSFLDKKADAQSRQ